MRSSNRRPTRPRTLVATALVAASVAMGGRVASAATAPGLGTADGFAVLGGAGVTNTGTTNVTGNLGDSPVGPVTDLGTLNVNGATHDNDGVAATAQADATNAYGVAAAAPVTGTDADGNLAAANLGPGVYNATANGPLTLAGVLTLSGAGVYIFTTDSTLITSSGSSVSLTGGAEACNIFWRVGSSATLATNSSFQGTILALTSIQMQTGATLVGRALAQTASVTLDANNITRPTCAVAAGPVTVPTAATTVVPFTGVSNASMRTSNASRGTSSAATAVVGTPSVTG